jgi:hypothetical protein
MGKDNCILYYLPNIGISDKYQIGNFTFWNYQRYRTEYIKDEGAGRSMILFLSII